MRCFLAIVNLECRRQSRRTDEEGASKLYSFGFASPVMRTIAGSLFIFCVLANYPSAASALPRSLSLGNLNKLTECELDRLFENAFPAEAPLGPARGQVLL